ncbi:MAG: VTT domain-containing protein [Proteobacteria bacterium]|nr:VTT domain-containing protein [Pseudomonadota bacterium]
MNDNSYLQIAESYTKKSYSALQEELQANSEKCINCKLCQKECEFLRKYGKPKEIADSFDLTDKTFKTMAFECSLCGLCAAVCPLGLNPADMFLEMRREAVKQGGGIFAEHNGILAYEKKGTSKLFSWYGLPEGCDTVFFPGCSLPGTRPDKTLGLFKLIQKKFPSAGIVFDCCTKPSHDLGRNAFFTAMFGEMKEFLIQNKIKKVLVACPNCYKIFDQYGGDISVISIYEFLADLDIPVEKKMSYSVTVHDPCALRYKEPVQKSVRKLIEKLGISIYEMPHSGINTLCCGEGGSVSFLSPGLAEKWIGIRKQEHKGNRVITYCAGCANHLNQAMPTDHIIDLYFEPEATLAGNAKIYKAPVTYLNRLKLKRHLKNSLNTAVSRERTFTGQEKSSKAAMFKRIVILLAIISIIILVRAGGLENYFETGALRELIASKGALAPILYMLIYIIAPALFLPGLPITIAGGILFGPLWGVIYTITSSTIGAGAAFLISRYVARDWIAAKLTSPRWQRLDEGVEKHGWKVVAFTRLIPLFPFNLLNYAFGLTKIKFTHYILATFICMLPACIAFIVFSSSLLDLFKGKISGNLLAGIILIIIVSLIPIFHKKYKTKKGTSDPL